MKNTRQGGTASVLRALAAALLAVLILVMPVAAATITGDHVVIRNTPEDKGQENSVGELFTGDTVTVLESTTDASGIEWYKIELPNKHQGYVKAQWVDNGGDSVQKTDDAAEKQEETAAVETGKQEETAADGTEDQGDEAAADQDGVDDGWTEEDPEMLAAQQEAEAAAQAGADEAAGDKETGKASDSQEAPDVDNGDTYNPYTDPDAHYSIHFYTENDGSGEWYIYNYDTDSRIKIGDLDELSEARAAEQKSASAAAIWRTIACVLLILLVILLIILYLFIRRGGPASGGRSSGRSRRRVIDEDEDDSEFDYSDEDEEESFDETGADSVDEVMEEAALDAGSVASIGAVTAAAGERLRSISSKEQAAADEEETAGNDISEDTDFVEESVPEDTVDDSGYEDEEEDEFDEDEDDEDEDEEYMGGKAPRKGGFLGFLKNIFSSEGLDDDEDDEDEDDEYDEDEEEEDEEDDYEDDEYDEDEDDEDDLSDEDEEEEEAPPVRKNRRQESRPARARRPRQRRTPEIEFDEELDYPEDAELMSFASAGTGKKKEEPTNTQAVPEASPDTVSAGVADDLDSDADFYADDDDDMDYSFLRTSSKRGRK